MIENGIAREPSIHEVMTLAEAAEYLKVSTETLHRLAESGQIPGRQIDEDWRFLKRALDHWLSAEIDSNQKDAKEELRLLEKWLNLMAHRMEDRNSSNKSTKPGSKSLVLRRFSIFENADDFDEVIENLRKARVEGDQ